MANFGLEHDFWHLNQNNLKCIQLMNLATEQADQSNLIRINQLPVSATIGLYYKSFTIVIYYCNDSGLYFKTTIRINLALSRSVNDEHKVRYKLKHTYDCKLQQ
jgi:hypothetical protein